jgi:hypothetical protein
MAEKIEIKVSYVRVTEYGLETHKDVLLDSILDDERKDVKVLSFLPIVYDGLLDITENLKGFAILENLNLPSMMTTSMEKVKRLCPLVKQIVALSRNTFEQDIAGAAGRVVGREEEGDNDAVFNAYITTDKEGNNSFVINPVHIDNHEIAVNDKPVERLTLQNVQDYVSGENGLIAVIDEINAAIEDPRCRIDIGKEILENLLQLFVEKGLTFEQFTIDFSKLYGKIESYKSIAKTVNQVSIKEEVETCIIETYQRVQQLMYENMLVEHAEILPKLVEGTDAQTENLLFADLSRYIVNLVTLSPQFDENYKEGNAVDTILNEIVLTMPRNVKSSKARDLLKKNLTQVVTRLKADKQDLFARIDKCIEERVGIDWARETFAGKFGLDLSKKQPRNLADGFIEALTTKNFVTLVKEDVLGIIANVKKEMGNGEIRSKEMLEIIRKVVEAFPTKEEIYNVLVEFVAKNGYSSIKQG